MQKHRQRLLERVKQTPTTLANDATSYIFVRALDLVPRHPNLPTAPSPLVIVPFGSPHLPSLAACARARCDSSLTCARASLAALASFRAAGCMGSTNGSLNVMAHAAVSVGPTQPSMYDHSTIFPTLNIRANRRRWHVLH